VQFRPFFTRQLVVDHQHLDFGSVWQIGGLVQDQPPVLHSDFSRVHRIDPTVIRRRSYEQATE
jgi:hypothetical protein